MALIYDTSSQHTIDSEKIIDFSINGANNTLSVRTKKGEVVDGAFEVRDPAWYRYHIEDDHSPVDMEEVFTGDGAQTDFTLVNPINSGAAPTVYLDGVEEGSANYTVNEGSGSGLGSTPGSISFSAAPASGVEIKVEYQRPQTPWFTDAMQKTLDEYVTDKGGTTTLRTTIGEIIYDILEMQGQMAGDAQVGV